MCVYVGVCVCVCEVRGRGGGEDEDMYVGEVVEWFRRTCAGRGAPSPTLLPPHPQVPRGYTCTTVEDLLRAYQLLGPGQVVSTCTSALAAVRSLASEHWPLCAYLL